MTKVSSAGVLGLVATPVGVHPAPTHDAPQISASLRTRETSPCVPMGIGVQSNGVRVGRFLMMAAASSCFFISVAFAVMAKSLSVANAQASSRVFPSR